MLKKHFFSIGLLFLTAKAMAVTYEAPYDPTLTYLNPVPSTAAVAGSAALIVTTNTARVGILICNECTSDIRVGNKSITTATGLLVAAGRCISLDLPRYFRGALWGISTSGSCKVSAIEALP